MPKLSDDLPDEHPRFLSLAATAMLIAPRTQAQGESLRATIDKIRKRLIYAAEIGDLQIDPIGLYSVSQVLVWAQRKWPGKFADAPIKQSATVKVNLAIRAEAWGFEIPGDLPRCQEVLKEALRHVRKLQAEIEALEAEIERLRPGAQKYERIKEQNARSAKRPRKGAP